MYEDVRKALHAGYERVPKDSNWTHKKGGRYVARGLTFEVTSGPWDGTLSVKYSPTSDLDVEFTRSLAEFTDGRFTRLLVHYICPRCNEEVPGGQNCPHCGV